MMLSNPWPSLAQQFGRQCVMNPLISEAELDTETERQARAIFPLIRKQMHGLEQTALDFGCGAGRWTLHLNRLLQTTTTLTVGYDPCADLIKLAPKSTLGISWESMSPELFFFRNQDVFDIAMIAMVLCLPHVNVDATAEGLVGTLAPNGLLILVDHMTNVQPPDKWAQFRPESFYVDLFARYGVRLAKIGEDKQLENPIVILAGRKT